MVIANKVHDTAEDDTDHVEFDLDELKEQLGIDGILEKLSDLAAKFCGEKSRTEYSGSEAQNSKSSSETVEVVFYPSAAVVSHEVASTNGPHEEEFKLPSVFEETESFGPEVAEVIAQRVNDACSKKAMDSKLKDLYEKYKTPSNCKYLCVPKVNLELWHDLSKESKSKDLGLQELQKGIVKASQPIIQLLDSALKARKDKSSLDPNDLLSLLTDAVTFLGNASFLTSLKRREFLKPDIARPYRSVCNKPNAITTCLFGDEFPKHIKEIGEVNKISSKVSGRPTSIKNMVSSCKRGSDTPSRSYPHRSGRKSTFLAGLPRSWKSLSRPATSKRMISSNNQHQATEGQSVNKVIAHSVPLLQAGSLSGNLPKWREFTSDPWILQTVSGYHLEFETTPHQVNLPKFPQFS